MICPYCKEELDPPSGVTCTSCRTPLHQECSALHGGRCVTLGCRSTTFEPSKPHERRRLEPAMPFSLTLRRGALAAASALVPSFEDAALAALALAGVTGIACLI